MTVSAGRALFPDRLTDRSPLLLPHRPQRARARRRTGACVRPLRVRCRSTPTERKPANRARRTLRRRPPALLRTPRPTCVHRPPSVESKRDDPLCRDCLAFECELSEILPTTSSERAESRQHRNQANSTGLYRRPPYVLILAQSAHVSFRQGPIYPVPLPIAT